MTAADLIRIESRIRDLWLDGQIPSLLHLCGGNEEQLLRIFSQIDIDRDWIFTSHRAHYHAMLFGMPEEELIAQIMEGRSMSLCWPRMVQSSIVAGTCSIAAGKAMAIKLRGGTERVWCFLGDGASDEGTFTEAARLVDARELPCRFILENNDSSCGVSQETRWGKWKDEWMFGSGFHWPSCVEEYRYIPSHPHAGTVEKMTLRPERIEAVRNAFG